MPAPDLAAIKQRQQATWASGDYASIGALIVPVAGNLCYPAGAFDAVLSVSGVMFAPDQARASAEIARVTRRGGRISLDGRDPGRLPRRHVPRRRRLDRSHAPRVQLPLHVTGRVRRVLRRALRATLKAFEALGAEHGVALASDLADLARRWDRLNEDGAIAITGDYLESVGIRR